MSELHAPLHPMPQAGTQEAVFRIVADVLKVPHVEPTDTFYDFGGTSLQAMRICARIGKELGLLIGPEALFESETLADVVAGTGI
ncbi:acyl carrier protein [Streptomyces virginiae]|uniref:acyl carrier protein n=1 Tax=Streptomyces virginiae TaxID=1961 RepID=UPI0036A81EA6